MKFLLPPYSKKHIIIFGSITFFVAIAFLFAIKYTGITNFLTSTISAEQVKSTYKDQLDTAQTQTAVKAWSKHNFIMLDIRSNEDFQKSHIKGAMSAPAEYIDKNMYNPKDTIIIYGDNSVDVQKASTSLKKMGVEKIEILTESLDSLKSKGYEITNE